MEFRETLPDGCPHDTARDIPAPTQKYRLIEGKTPTEKDFDSFFKRKGHYVKSFKYDHCDQNGVSLYAKIEGAEMLFKGPSNSEGRWQSIGEVTLTPGAGMLDPEREDSHQTWWPTKDFDPVANCRIVK